jgi:ribosomal protein L3 glutamine methyltransferase
MSAAGVDMISAVTVADLVRDGTRRLETAGLVFGHGTTNAAEEAAWLVAHALNRIIERKPAAYLVSEAWLGDSRFYVDERVIVPRSHIAGLLDEDLAPWIERTSQVRSALDLGTGSGCLAVLLARSFPRARIDAADISKAALAVARVNVRRYRVGQRTRLIESDLFSALRGKRYDLIVSNPPYVTSAAMGRLPREYRHEPRLALAAGKDGLDVVRRILRQARRHLNPGGVLVVEVGSGRRRIERAFPRNEFLWPETAAGHPVFIVWREQLPEG